MTSENLVWAWIWLGSKPGSGSLGHTMKCRKFLSSRSPEGEGLKGQKYSSELLPNLREASLSQTHSLHSTCSLPCSIWQEWMDIRERREGVMRDTRSPLFMSLRNSGVGLGRETVSSISSLWGLREQRKNRVGRGENQPNGDDKRNKIDVFSLII